MESGSGIGVFEKSDNISHTVIFSEPLVSIIVPIFNVCAYLEESLDSLICQTYKNIGILVIDDGSSDGSETICDQYAQKDSRIQVTHQINRGLSAARNVGLNQAIGQIIAFLDPDDAYSPHMIKVLLEIMEKEDSDIVICGFSVQNTQRRMELNREVNKEVQTIAINKLEAYDAILSRRINTAVWNKVYKKAFGMI